MKITVDSTNTTIAEALRTLAFELEHPRSQDPVHLARLGNAILSAGQATTHKAYLDMGRQQRI